MFSNRNCVLSLLQIVTKNHKDVRLMSRAVKLVEIGKLQNPRSSALHYDTGQLFFHKVFGFRGIVLFPWKAKVIVKADQTTINEQNRNLDSTIKVDDMSTGDTATVETYYQVLIDKRDLDFVRIKSHGHTLLTNAESMDAIKGLESVSHDDIIPYHPTEPDVFRHEKLTKLLTHDPRKEPCFTATERLEEWRKKYSPWLDLTQVHKGTTQNVRVTVMPFYMGCSDTVTKPLYWWRYVIRLENLNEETVTLRERVWNIYTNVGGKLMRITGKGVVGEEPILSRSQRAFQYSSHVHHECPSGHMWGHYTMEKENGVTFDCSIPACQLESKPDELLDPTASLLV